MEDYPYFSVAIALNMIFLHTFLLDGMGVGKFQTLDSVKFLSNNMTDKVFHI